MDAFDTGGYELASRDAYEDDIHHAPREESALALPLPDLLKTASRDFADEKSLVRTFRNKRRPPPPRK